MKKLHALQYLRAFAALVVVYSHAVMQVDHYSVRLPEFGSFGVDIFFVISGFIMVYIARPDDTPTRFFVNRVRRVVPLYWFFTLLMAAILLLRPDLFKNTVYDTLELTKSLFFVPFYSSAHPGELWPVVAPGWSLNYEMYFYLLFALSLLFAARLRVAMITAAIIVVFLAASWLQPTGNGLGAALDGFLGDAIVFEFVFGMVLALLWKRDVLTLSPRTGALLLLAGLVLLFLKLPLPRVFEYGVPALMIVMGCLFIEVPKNRLLLLLGDASYSLYLSHIFALGLFRKVLPPLLDGLPMAHWWFVALSLVGCLIVSVFVHWFVDNWLLRRERYAWFVQQRNDCTTPSR